MGLFTDKFFGPFDKRVEGNLAKDSQTIAVYTEKDLQLERGETIYVEDFLKRLQSNWAALQHVAGHWKDLQSSISEEDVEELISDAKMIVDNKQYLLGATEGIKNNAAEILRVQKELMKIASSFDPKLTSDSVQFVKDEQGLILLTTVCGTCVNEIIGYARQIRDLDPDDFLGKDRLATNKRVHDLLAAMQKSMDSLLPASKQLSAGIVKATIDVKNLKTDSIELKTKFDYLLKVMHSGVPHDFKLAPEHQRILDAERKRA